MPFLCRRAETLDGELQNPRTCQLSRRCKERCNKADQIRAQVPPDVRDDGFQFGTELDDSVPPCSVILARLESSRHRAPPLQPHRPVANVAIPALNLKAELGVRPHDFREVTRCWGDDTRFALKRGRGWVKKGCRPAGSCLGVRGKRRRKINDCSSLSCCRTF